MSAFITLETRVLILEARDSNFSNPSIFPSNFIVCERGVICNQFWRRPAHATTSSTRQFDSPYLISYRYSIATKSVSPAVFEIMGIKHYGVTTLSFLGHVTSRDIPPQTSYARRYNAEA